MSSQSYNKVKGNPDLLYNYFMLEGDQRLSKEEFYQFLHIWFNMMGVFNHPAVVENQIINWLKKKYEKDI